MHTSESTGVERPVVFCLHYLGGSARTWDLVTSQLAGTLRCVAVDLPGFGAAADVSGYTVADMAAYVACAVRAKAPRRWVIAGHSMGAKVATLLARMAQDGTSGLAGLEGLVLLAGSPPDPEPMDDEQRQNMLGWFAGDAASNRAEARRYIGTNSASKLDPATAEGAVVEVLRANRTAWIAWLNSGSREDWSDRIGVLQTPALIVAGTDDPKLGPDTQRGHTAPHFAHVRVVALPGVQHLLPLECAHETARLIEEHVRFVERKCDAEAAANESYRALIASRRVSRATREALQARSEPADHNTEPVALSVQELTALRAVLHRVLPQPGPQAIDLAACIDAQLGAGVGDGWRFATLPDDAQAYRDGLATLDAQAARLHHQPFSALDGWRQDQLITRIAEGRLGGVGDGASSGRLTCAQMQSWFEDLRADAVKAYVAHPRTLARIGYGGIANGGDGLPKTGFIRVGIDQREAWEPTASIDGVA